MEMWETPSHATLPRMTNEERWIIQGRAREALREAKRNLATLRTEIDEHADRLQEAAGCLRHFLNTPPGSGPTGMTPREYLLHFFGNFVEPDWVGKLQEYEAELKRVLELEVRVKEFE